MEMQVTLSDGKKDFSFKVVGIDPREFKRQIVDFVELDVNILINPPKEEKEALFKVVSIIENDSIRRCVYEVQQGGVIFYLWSWEATILEVGDSIAKSVLKKAIDNKELFFGDKYGNGMPPKDKVLKLFV